MDYLELAQIAEKVALAAGSLLLERPAILEVSTKSSEVDVVTQMDRASEALITSMLAQLRPEDGLLGEEGADVLSKSGVTWVIDPLDGTKEFINKNGEFTINLALMFINKPIWGIVSAPFFNKTYYINSKNQVILKDNGKSRVLKPKSKFIDNELTAVVSRSHLDTKTKLKLQKNNITKIILSGSSLKFMMIVERKANIYYRLAPTMEWDTAASHAILKNLNYNIYKEDENSEIEYNKKNLLNPNFISF